MLDYKSNCIKGLIVFILFSLVVTLPVSAVTKYITPEGYIVYESEESDIVVVEQLESKRKVVEKESKFARYASEVAALKSGCRPAETSGLPNLIKKGTVVAPSGDNFFVTPIKERLTNLPTWLPPHPKDAGKVHIHGIDRDLDCVRDDIEHYIVQEFPNANQRIIRKYLFEYAVWLNHFLILGISQNTSRGASNELAKAGLCIDRFLGRRSDSVLTNLFAEFHNTYPRSFRYIDNLKQIAGWTTREDLLVSCL